MLLTEMCKKGDIADLGKRQLDGKLKISQEPLENCEQYLPRAPCSLLPSPPFSLCMTFIKNASHHSSSVGAVKLHGVSHFYFSMFAWAKVSPMVGSENPAVLDGKVVAITGKSFSLDPSQVIILRSKFRSQCWHWEGDCS